MTMSLDQNFSAMDVSRPLLLSDEQLSILGSKSKSKVIAALAGTGKTTTLACQTAKELGAGKKILVLAYSNAGVQAFKSKLATLARPSPNIQITTLERWCARQLKQQYAGVKFVVDSLELRGYAIAAKESLEQKQDLYPDENLMVGDLDMQEFQAFNRSAKKSLMLQQLEDQGVDLLEFCDTYMLNYSIAKLFREYEQLRIDSCGDIRYFAEGDCTYELATNEAAIATDYDWVIFDEMHDLDLASMRVLKKILVGSGASFIGAGDFNQHIEAQAWSIFTHNKLAELIDFLPNDTVSLPLTVSRRFGGEVADVVNNYFSVGMQSAPSCKSTVVRELYSTDDECLSLLASAYKSIRQDGDTSGSPLTLILRNSEDLQPIEWMLDKQNLSVGIFGFKPFYLYKEIGLILGLMYAHRMEAEGWKSSECLLPSIALEAFIDGALFFGKGRQAQKGESLDVPTMAQQMHGYPKAIWSFLMTGSSLGGGSRNLSAFGKFLMLPGHFSASASELLDQVDLQGLLTGVAMTSEDRALILKRVELFKQSVKGMSVVEVLSAVARINARTYRKLQASSPFDVQIFSVEQAKGQEFKYVALPFLGAARFPATSPRELAFLERNRLYVAMTRAKQKLWLLDSTTRPVGAFD